MSLALRAFCRRSCRSGPAAPSTSGDRLINRGGEDVPPCLATTLKAYMSLWRSKILQRGENASHEASLVALCFHGHCGVCFSQLAAIGYEATLTGCHQRHGANEGRTGKDRSRKHRVGARSLRVYRPSCRMLDLLFDLGDTDRVRSWFRKDGEWRRGWQCLFDLRLLIGTAHFDSFLAIGR